MAALTKRAAPKQCPYLRHVTVATLTFLLAACVGTAEPHQDSGAVPLSHELLRYRVTLLGEVHDNAHGHAQRTQALADAIKAGWRPAIVMEQFDREHQSALDQALVSCKNAACVIQAASPGKASWNWDFYRPVIDLALQYELPLLAANLSRKDAGRIMKEGLAGAFTSEELEQLGLNKQPNPALLEAQRREVANGHCGMLPASMHTPMAMAQLARDAVMAMTVRRAFSSGRSGQTRPVVLLAGNGHVRRDYGVPQWLDSTRVMAVGFTEGVAATGMFDRNVVIPPAQRADPCASLRK